MSQPVQSFPGRMIASYELKHQIGSGSFAVVWEAVHRETGQVVALKEIKMDKLNAKLRDNLKSEVAILQQIHHRNIVRLLDVMQEGSNMFLAMEFCAGGDLAGYIRRCCRVPEVTACAVMRQLAAGLRQLWSKNLVHRDLKPQNLLLSDNTPQAVLKIADFGFARNLEPQNLAETMCGSPLYMAPEILQFHKYDAKADLWSVGTILFELLVGKPPFNSFNQMQLLQNIQRNEARIPDAVACQLSDSCKDLIYSLLKRNPVERISFEEFFSHPFLGLRGGPVASMMMSRVCNQAEAAAGDAANVQRIAGQPVTACDGSLPFVLDDDAVATTFAEPLPSHSQRLLAQPLAEHQPPRRSPSRGSSPEGGAEPQGFGPERDVAPHAEGLAAYKAALHLQSQGSAGRQASQGLSPHVAHLAVQRPQFGHKTSAGAQAGRRHVQAARTPSVPVPGLGPAALSQKEAAPQGLSRHPSLPGTPPGTHPAPVTPAGGGPDAARPGLQGRPVVQHPLQQPAKGGRSLTDSLEEDEGYVIIHGPRSAVSGQDSSRQDSLSSGAGSSLRAQQASLARTSPRLQQLQPALRQNSAQDQAAAAQTQQSQPQSRQQRPTGPHGAQPMGEDPQQTLAAPQPGSESKPAEAAPQSKGFSPGAMLDAFYGAHSCAVDRLGQLAGLLQTTAERAAQAGSPNQAVALGLLSLQLLSAGLQGPAGPQAVPPLVQPGKKAAAAPAPSGSGSSITSAKGLAPEAAAALTAQFQNAVQATQAHVDALTPAHREDGLPPVWDLVYQAGLQLACTAGCEELMGSMAASCQHYAQAGILLMLLHQQPVNTDQSSFSPSCNLLPADRQRLQKYVPSIAARLADAARQAF